MSENLQAAMAIVTGASSGIGEATALRLAEEGARVVLVGRRRGRLDTVAESIETRGGEVVVVEADITDADAAAEVVATAVDRFGRLDILVNAAGVMLNGETRLRPRLDEWDRKMTINLQGLMYIRPRRRCPTCWRAPEVQHAPGRRRHQRQLRSPGVPPHPPWRGGLQRDEFGVTAAHRSLAPGVTPRAGVRFSSRSSPVPRHRTVRSPAAGTTRGRTKPNGFAGVEKLRPRDIADAAAYIATSPRRRAINEVVIRPTDQAA